jgi:hypothetical protein
VLRAGAERFALTIWNPKVPQPQPPPPTPPPTLSLSLTRFAVTIWYMGARTWVPPTGTAHDSSLVPLWEEEGG